MNELKHPIMRYHGGKWKIAPWIIRHFPEHSVYVEPFGGGGSVLMRKYPSRAEVYNDLDGEIVNVFRVLRDREQAERLSELVSLTPYAREEFEMANKDSADPVERARRTLFRAWASFGSAGATRGRCGFRTYTKPDGRYMEVTKSWSRISEAIAAFTQRLKNVVIENRPAIDVMSQHDSYNTLFYVDPPYLPETRSFNGGRYYRWEMSSDGHIELLEFLEGLEGMVILSGYPSDMYNVKLKDWRRLTLRACGSSRYGGVIRRECLWIKPGCEVGQMTMF